MTTIQEKLFAADALRSQCADVLRGAGSQREEADKVAANLVMVGQRPQLHTVGGGAFGQGFRG